MAAGPAGVDVAVPMPGDYDDVPESIETLRATMERMSDSINSLSKQVGFLVEEPKTFYTRQPGDLDLPTESTTEDEKGPAVRVRMYDQTVQSDRNRMESLHQKMEYLESTLALYLNQKEEMGDKLETMNEALTSLRSDVSSSRATVTGAGRDRQIVTAIRGFDKLKTYRGAATEWKEWRFKLTTWLAQSSPSYETLMVKLDYSDVEPVEPSEGLTLMAGASELTTDEEWCSEQLYQLLVQKCEGPALDIIRNQNTKGKARGLIAWYRTLREAEGQVPAKEPRNHGKGIPARPQGGRGQGRCINTRGI